MECPVYVDRCQRSGIGESVWTAFFWRIQIQSQLFSTPMANSSLRILTDLVTRQVIRTYVQTSEKSQGAAARAPRLNNKQVVNISFHISTLCGSDGKSKTLTVQLHLNFL
jgi:hypothetical protein